MNKYFILLLTVLFFLACSSDNSANTSTLLDRTINDLSEKKSKSIYYKKDFLNDVNLSVTEKNVALFKVSNTLALDEVIPFIVETEGDYQFCFNGAQNILRVEIFDDTNKSIFFNEPKFVLRCKVLHLLAQRHTLNLTYVNKINSMYGAEVPYVRLFDKREIRSDLTVSE